jgi:hypothetical protein
MNTGSLKRRRITVDDIIFIYKKGNQFKVLSIYQSDYGKALSKGGWKHIETISASVWLENLLNVTPEDRELALDELLGKEDNRG